MMKRILTTMLTLLLLVALFPTNALAATDTYLNADKYFVVAPAEKWDNSNPDSEARSLVSSKEWELTAQSYGNSKGDDIQLYQFGVSSKFCSRENIWQSDDQIETFKIQLTDFQETAEGYYWDVQGASTKSGKIIHLWSHKDDEDESQRFYLEEDHDSDPETFYIKSYNSGKFLVPRDFFKDVDKPAKGKNWDTEDTWGIDGPNVVQSNMAFRWRIHVLDQEADGTDDYVEWMSQLDGDTYLSQLTIPGTHDSCTANVQFGAVSSFNNFSCQKYFIDEQLIAGIRAFDLRTREKNGDFVMAHGDGICREPGRGDDDPADLTLKNTLLEMKYYLDRHKQETIIVCLKMEDGSEDADIKRRLAQFLKDQFETHPNLYHKWNDVAHPVEVHSPQLKDVRGKMVMFSRVDFSDIVDDSFTQADLDFLRSYMGPDLSQWDARYSDKNDYAQIITDIGAPIRVWVQDDWHCDFDAKEKKFLNTIDQINGKAAADTPDEKDFVFNYTSATFGSDQFTPLEASRKMNDLIFYGNDDGAIFKDRPRGGIIMMDFATKALAQIMITQNDSYRIKSYSISPNHFHPLLSNSDLNDSPISTNPMSVADEEQELLASGAPEIFWATGAAVTYGYTLNEAKLVYDENALDFDDSNAPNTIRGFFYFENGAEILTVEHDNGKNQTLIFQSYDGKVKESKAIPVTVNPRPLPIRVGNYEIEYGEEFDINQADYPSAGGYFLSADQAALDQITTAAGLHYKAVDKAGKDVTITAETKPCRGVIQLTANNLDAITHPNYDISVKNGVWVVQPRTVSVDWSYTSNGWEASIGNIINGDEVLAVVTPDAGGKSATLTLGGADAASYRIAEGEEFSGVRSSGGRSGADDTAAQECTVSLAGNSTAALLEETTVVLDLSDKEITSLLNSSNEVTIDISQVENADSLRIPAALLSTQSIVIQMADGMLTLDEATLKDFVRQGGDLELSIRQETDSQGRPVFSLTASLGGKAVTEFAGTVTAKLPYLLPDGSRGEDVVVALRTEKGLYEQTDCTYDAQTGMAVVRLQHFSDYVVAELPFDDVDPQSWYYADVLNSYLSGLLQGDGPRRFSPEKTTTRAMLVTVLWRLDGAPTPNGPSGFADVPADVWYAAAVAWASENGIVDGYDKDRFGPMDELSREQMAAILYRYAQYKGYNVSVGEDTNILSYNDALDVAEYAIPAMQWACGAGLIQGSNGNLLPQGGAQRCQVAAILHRFCEAVVK